MGTFRRLGILALCTAALIAGGIAAGKLYPKEEPARAGPEKGELRPPDTSDYAAWRERHPWLFRDTAFAAYRDPLLLPLLRQAGGPRQLRKHPGYLEAVFPRGRPLHAWAWSLESLAVAGGIGVTEGRELNPPGTRAQYRLQAPWGPDLVLRLSEGKAAKPGAARLALVLCALDKADAAAARRLLHFPYALTLAVPVGDSIPATARWGPVLRGKEILLELPMEPASYPYVKPGPGALFIHHSRQEVEDLLEARLRRFPAAKGFATTYGDRAIENRPLLEHVLGFMARRSRVFLDLTGSPRSLTGAVALKTGTAAYTARAQDFRGRDALETELARRCVLAQKAGEGVWVLRYAPGLPETLETLWREQEDRFEAIGLEWVTLSALRGSRK